MMNDGFAGVQTFLRDLSYGEVGLVEAEELGSTTISGGQPWAGGE